MPAIIRVARAGAKPVRQTSAQDGLRLRAHAMASNFRRRDKLAELHAQAQAQVLWHRIEGRALAAGRKARRQPFRNQKKAFRCRPDRTSTHTRPPALPLPSRALVVQGAFVCEVAADLLLEARWVSLQFMVNKPKEDLSMRKTLSSIAVAALALFSAHGVLAQAPSRAEVKKEIAEANKAGQIPGTSTGPSADVTPPISTKSDTTRAEVNKETAAANKAGKILGSGTGPSDVTAGELSPKQKAATSTTTREERKKATAAANKAGKIPENEAQLQNPKK